MLRHYMATRMRRVEGISVPREQRAQWMGHEDPKHKQTQWYESFDPDYLEEAMRATDAIMLALDKICRRRSLFAPIVPDTKFTVVEGGKDKTGTENE
jgi:hypothetical protein